MTRLNWDKAARYEPDPGAVVEVPEIRRPSTAPVGPKERAKRQGKRAKENAALLERSEQKRLKAIAQKKERLAALASGKVSRWFDKSK